MLAAKIIATVFGIGYINKGKGAGTLAAIAFCALWYYGQPFHSFIIGWLPLIIVLAAGTWAGYVVEKDWGKDNSKVVIDEYAGQLIALLTIPVNIKYGLAALVLFRFFDMVKPLGIKYFEKLPGGIGVMADDVAAGIYSLIILKTAIAIHLF